MDSAKVIAGAAAIQSDIGFALAMLYQSRTATLQRKYASVLLSRCYLKSLLPSAKRAFKWTCSSTEVTVLVSEKGIPA